MSLPLGQDPFQKFDEPLGLMRIVATSQERSEPSLLINQPFSPVFDVLVGFDQMLSLKAQLPGDVGG